MTISITKGGNSMYCPKCGNELKDGVMFCGNCGMSVNAIEGY